MLPLAVRRLRDAANLPSHISIFGDTASRASSMGAGAVGANGAGVGADGSPDAGPRTQVDKSLGLNLPSHISIFGDGPEGEELQQLQELAAQQAQQHQQQQHPGRMAGGAWGLAVEDSAIVDGGWVGVALGGREGWWEGGRPTLGGFALGRCGPNKGLGDWQ